MHIGLFIAASITALTAACSPSEPAAPPAAAKPTWSVSTSNDILAIGYGTESDSPQYAALHLNSGYLRLNTGPGSGWGTSVVVLPSLWTGGKYIQGDRVGATTTVGEDLEINLTSEIAGLKVTGTIRLHPPAGQAITADVLMNTTGTVALDTRACEAFKPMMLSSMHISDTQWDTQGAEINGKRTTLPAQGWIVAPPCPQGSRIMLTGGTSSFKTKAPTVSVTLTEASLGLTGWVTSSTSTDSDNVALWAASDKVLSSWRYTIAALP